MTQPVTIEWPVELNLNVAPDALGRTITLGTENSVTVDIVLPDKAGAMGDAAQVYWWEQDVPRAVAVNRVRLIGRCTTEMDQLATVPEDHEGNPDEVAEAIRLRDTATVAADKLMTRFLDLVAVRRGQLRARIDRRPLAQLSRLNAGVPPNRIKFGYSPVTVDVYLGGEGLSAAELVGFAAEVTAGRSVGLRWQSYREAHLRMFVDDDVQAAVVAAETAVEVGSKEAFMRAGAKSKQIQATRIQMLTETLCAKHLGKTYSSADKANCDLVHQLAAQRNRLVHHGDAPDPAAIRNQLAAVRGYLAWLDAMAPWSPPYKRLATCRRAFVEAEPAAQNLTTARRLIGKLRRRS